MARSRNMKLRIKCSQLVVYANIKANKRGRKSKHHHLSKENRNAINEVSSKLLDIKEEAKESRSVESRNVKILQNREISQMYKTKLRENEDSYVFEYQPPQTLKFNKELESQCDEQNDYWHVWIDGGNIMLWDSCPKVFHRTCLELKKQPTKSWQWPYCTGEWAHRCPIWEEKCDDPKYSENKNDDKVNSRGRKGNKSHQQTPKKIGNIFKILIFDYLK